jgi:hypothetical protein
MIRRLFTILASVSVVAWVVNVLASKHHHAITLWLVIALGLLAATFCTAWLDERATVRRLESPEPFEAWIPRRLQAVAQIKRQRAKRGDEWFCAQTRKWETENVNQMAGYDSHARPTGDGLAPELVADYRRNAPGTLPPHDVREVERQFERQIDWLKRTQRDLRGGSWLTRLKALLGRKRADRRVSQGSSDPRGAELDQGREPGEGEGTTDI